MKLEALSARPIFAFTILLIAACGVVSPSHALAQSAGSSTDSSATNSATRLPLVTVTAQKEPAPAQSLPLSVTAVTHDTLAGAGVREVREAAIYAPNTFMNEFTARALSNPFFRGIGGSPANPGVTTFIDGVPQLNSYSSSIELVDVDQIEFVRGPQGALFGRNTAGGLINITSGRPSETGGAGGLDFNYGNYNLLDARAVVSGPLSKDGAALSVAGGYSGRDGYTVNDFDGHRVDSRGGEFGKGQLLYQFNERLELRLIISGEHDEDGDYALGDLAAIRANPNHVSHDFEGFNRRDLASATMLVNFRGDAVDVASTTGGSWWKNHGLTDLDYQVASLANGGLFATRDNVEEQHQFTQEFRVSSAKDKPVALGDAFDLAWQAGVFAFLQDYQQAAANNIVSLFGFFPPNSTLATADLDDWGVGVYGQAKLTAWEKLDVAAGLRFDYEDKQADLFSSTGPLIGLPATQNLSDTFAEVSPQFSLAYHIASNQLAYVSVARGYKAGGFNPLAPAGSSEYGTEHSWNYEIGYKSRWFDDRLQTTLALFYIDWQRLQLNQPVPFSGGQYFIGNAGAADSKGVEFEARYRACSHLDLFGSVGYDDARFTSGSTAFNANTGLNQGVGGNRLPYSPAFTGNVGAQTSWAPCKAATLYARAEVNVYGDFQYDAFGGSPGAQSQSTYSLANFRAGVRGEMWYVEGWVANAFDTHYVPIAIQYAQLGAPSGYVGESGAPVTFGVRAGFHF